MSRREIPPTIRPAVRADCPGILAIYNDAVLTTTASYDYEPRSLEHRHQWFDDHAKGDFPIFVAVEAQPDGSELIIGWSALNKYHDRIGYRFTTENSVYVAASHRGLGIGSLLLAPLIPAARERGLHAIIAVIDASNDVSVRLHAKFGFEHVGRFKEVGFKFGRWLDVAYMELRV
ncbi:MAG TPA: GNAT family N-acetyltransferase [Candidatus Limnocylindria bacterium]|nr:GNAT family N-acetyltransferase [Candidatus Limnocylindria bacterium]